MTPIDVLLTQVGTPDSPTPAALRAYLREFLGDPRVLEMPAIWRWLLVNLVIVPFRAPRSAAKYRRIWNGQTGSPLLEITRRQSAALAEVLRTRFRVHFAMRYGNPSVRDVVQRIVAEGCSRLVVLPMFPQYSAATSASGLDAVFAALARHRVLPALRVIGDYHDEPDYIEAVASSIERTVADSAARGARPDFFLLSFHGLPLSFIQRGDPYQKQVETTAARIAERLAWPTGRWQLCYQSRFGRQPWLAPHTDQTLRALARDGVRTVLVATPGFTTDCLETIDEIGCESALEFQSAGGQTLVRVPCLNDDPAFVAALAGLVQREAQGWG